MPLYDYDCADCGERFEVLRGVHDPAPSSCLLCGGGPLKKAFTTPAIHFKGSGWAKKERRAGTSHSSTKAARDGATTGTDGGSKGKDGGSKGKDGGSGESSGNEGSKARDGAPSASGETTAAAAPGKASTSSATSDGSSGSASKAD